MTEKINHHPMQTSIKRFMWVIISAAFATVLLSSQADARSKIKHCLTQMRILNTLDSPAQIAIYLEGNKAVDRTIPAHEEILTSLSLPVKKRVLYFMKCPSLTLETQIVDRTHAGTFLLKDENSGFNLELTGGLSSLLLSHLDSYLGFLRSRAGFYGSIGVLKAKEEESSQPSTNETINETILIRNDTVAS